MVPHPQQHFLVLVISTAVILAAGVKGYLVVVLICISLMANDVEHLFMCFLDYLCTFSEEMSIMIHWQSQ